MHSVGYNKYTQWRISQKQQNFIMFVTVLRQHVSILIESSSGPSKISNVVINTQWCVSQTPQNFIMFIIVLGQHVSILTESSSGPSKENRSLLNND